MVNNPYQPPAADLGDGAPGASRSLFTPPRTGLLIGLGLNLAASVGTLGMLVMQDSMIGEALGMEALDAASAEASDTRLAAVGSVEVLTYLACIVLWGMWQVRAARNARALEPLATFGFGPGWGFGYFFVPFLNLVRPYQAMKEIWTHSAPRPEGGGHGIISLWWLVWIASNVVANVSMHLGDGEKATLGELRSQGRLDMAATVLGIAASLCAITLVRRLNGDQLEKWRAQRRASRP